MATVSLENVLMYDNLLVDDSTQESRVNDMRAADEATLVGWARSGDYRAFEELVCRYRNDVFARAYHFVRNREDAWDLSQEAFIKAHKGIRHFRGDSSFKTWILRIVTNQCKDAFKKRRLNTVAFDEALGTGLAASKTAEPAHALEAREIGDAINKALEDLPAKQRTAFVLREYEDLTYDEIAQEMGCKLGTVMSRLFHARRKLQDLLARQGLWEGRMT